MRFVVGTIGIAKAKAKAKALKTAPFEIQSCNSLDFKCFQILSGQISDPNCIQMVRATKYQIVKARLE